MTSLAHASRLWSGDPPPAGWAGPWCAVAALGAWTATRANVWLALASAAAVAGAVWGPRRGPLRALGSVVLLAGIVTAFAGHHQTSRLRTGWAAYWAEREAEVGARLAAELEALLRDGEAASEELAALGSDPGTVADARRLAELRKRYGLSALALYDPLGELRMWDGAHRGSLPPDVERGLRRYAYGDRPLFGYLYVTAPAGEAGTAVVATLLRADLPGALGAGAGDFASRFRARVGERIRIFPVPLAEGQGGWALELGERTLFSVVVDPPQPGVRVAEVLSVWTAGVSAAALLAWTLLVAGGRSRHGAGLAAALSLVALAATLPLPGAGSPHALAALQPSAAAGSTGVFPGRLTFLALAAVTLVAAMPRPAIRIPPVVAAGTVGLVFPAALAALRALVPHDALAEGQAAWLAHQVTESAALTILAALALTLARSRPRSSAGGRLAGASAGLGLAFGAGASWWVWAAGGIPLWWAALWALPAGLAAAAVASWSGWRRALGCWCLAGTLGGSAALPAAWADRVAARMRAGAERLDLLDAPSLPRVEAGLRALAVAADSLDRRGADGVDLLYGSLRGSGLPEEGWPVRLTLWSPAGLPLKEIRVGVGAERSPVLDGVVRRSESSPAVLLLEYERSDARFVARVPVRDGRVVTAAVPPYSDRAVRTALSPLLVGGVAPDAEPLTLIPLLPAGEWGSLDVGWRRVERGWQAERLVPYDDAVFHAHYTVDLPGPLLAAARGTLVLAIDIGLVLAFWGLGHVLPRGAVRPAVWRKGVVFAFRTRVTFALFGFFVLAVAIFGTLAYRSINGVSRRAASVLAERVTEDAAGSYYEESGAMTLLARRVGTELLEYRRGKLREGSREEVVELGLYEAWVPFEIERLLAEGEIDGSAVEGRLGSWPYITAYRRLPDGDVLAAQVPLEAGASAVRSQDVLHILGFTVVLGAVLSLGLALLVSRALTRPIHALQEASERVGKGDLALRLPGGRPDEFGSVFRAFNRMVVRLRRARRQLLRTTRRTQAIMDEAAVGMVALDPDGVVTLVNRRAESLLAGTVAFGHRLPAATPFHRSLVDWIDGCLGGGVDEADTELHHGSRRIRVRARRLDVSGAGGGLVVALEDVTDELRTERVLAWGEMARQIAHEVKNPLTPIKLGVQHVRRAREDRRPDFDEILARSTEAILREIDRLAAIARSFSRFGAPSEPGAGEPEPVDMASVVGEVLALYEASAGCGHFEGHVARGLAPARARAPEVKEVLVNLLENAREAIDDVGTVRVRVRPGEPGRIHLDVEDDGHGVAPDILPRVFEPRFSTRSRGTGLGLAIVRRLVESWGGSVSMESRLGRGTRVSVVLQTWTDDGRSGTGDDRSDSAS